MRLAPQKSWAWLKTYFRPRTAAFGCVLLGILLSPHNVWWTARFYRVAMVLFVVAVLSGRSRIKWQRLFLPLLVFLFLAGLSTLFSSAPVLSLERLAWLSLLGCAIVTAEVLEGHGQVKLLIVVLLSSSFISIARTGWQYGHGIGVRLTGLSADNPLTAHGLLPDDMVQSINRHPTRSPAQFYTALSAVASDQRLNLVVARGAPIVRRQLEVGREELEVALKDPTLKVERGRPVRAQGRLYHYIPYAGFLSIVMLLAWGLLLAASSWTARVPLLIFVVSCAAALGATLTRAYLAAVPLSALAMLWIVSSRKARIFGVAAALALLIAATIWVQQQRGLGWLAAGDAGTQYRIAMWKDGLRLIREHPLVGIGFDATMSGRWRVEAYQRFPLVSHFHSTPIQLAVDAGLPTLAAWVWLAVSFFLLLLRVQRHSTGADEHTRGVSLGLVGVATVFYLVSLVHYNQGEGEIIVLMAPLMGIGVALERILERQSSRDEPPKERHPPAHTAEPSSRRALLPSS